MHKVWMVTFRLKCDEPLVGEQVSKFVHEHARFLSGQDCFEIAPEVRWEVAAVEAQS